MFDVFMKKLILILLFLPCVALAYTSPGQPRGFVNDYAGVLDFNQKQELELLLSDYEIKTSNEISIVFINELVDETIETYAVKLFEDWGIGKKDKDNGVLFLASIKDRQMRIEVGYGLEGDLTDIESGRIVNNIVPQYFKEEDYSGGAMAATQGIISAIGADYEIPSSIEVVPLSQKNYGFHITEYFWFIIFIFIWMGSVFARSRSWWLGGVIGAIAGVIILISQGSWIWLPILIFGGLFFDYIVSTKYKQAFTKGAHSSVWPWLFLMGGRPGGRWDKGPRGGFGGFGGGSSGGGGASGRW